MSFGGWQLVVQQEPDLSFPVDARDGSGLPVPCSSGSADKCEQDFEPALAQLRIWVISIAFLKLFQSIALDEAIQRQLPFKALFMGGNLLEECGRQRLHLTPGDVENLQYVFQALERLPVHLNWHGILPDLYLPHFQVFERVCSDPADSISAHVQRVVSRVLRWESRDGSVIQFTAVDLATVTDALILQGTATRGVPMQQKNRESNAGPHQRSTHCSSESYDLVCCEQVSSTLCFSTLSVCVNSLVCSRWTFTSQEWKACPADLRFVIQVPGFNLANNTASCWEFNSINFFFCHSLPVILVILRTNHSVHTFMCTCNMQGEKWTQSGFARICSLQSEAGPMIRSSIPEIHAHSRTCTRSCTTSCVFPYECACAKYARQVNTRP